MASCLIKTAAGQFYFYLAEPWSETVLVLCELAEGKCSCLEVRDAGLVVLIHTPAGKIRMERVNYAFSSLTNFHLFAPQQTMQHQTFAMKLQSFQHENEGAQGIHRKICWATAILLDADQKNCTETL